MPLFFIMSGMLFHRDRYPCFTAFLKKRIRSLLCPYILFAVLTALWYAFLNLVSGEKASAVLANFAAGLLDFAAARGSKYLAYNSPLWFVPCLFVVEMIYYFLSGIGSKVLKAALILAVTAVGWYSESAYCPIDTDLLPWSINSACFALGFYALGNLFADGIVRLDQAFGSRRSRLVLAGALLVLCAALVPLALRNGSVSIGSKRLGNGFLFYLTGLIGSAAVLLLALAFRRSAFLRLCGKNSFTIMATHIVVVDTINSLCHFLHISWYDYYGVIQYSIGQSLLLFAVVILVCAAFSFVYGKLKTKILRPSTP